MNTIRDKIYNSLNNIVLSDSQKACIYQNITRPRNKIGGYVLKTCMIAACFMFTFILFSKKISVDDNNIMPRTINNNCEKNCDETFKNE